MDALRRRWLQFGMAGVAMAIIPACRKNEVARFGEGDHFPELALPDLASGKLEFADDSSVPMLVNFWASWCDPCRHEMPALEKLSRLFRRSELLVVGVAVDSDVNLAREFSLHHGLTFPLLTDRNRELSSGLLHLSVFPVSYLLKRDRIIARIVTGELDWASPEMIREMEALLVLRPH